MSKPEIVAIAPPPAFFAKPLHENFTVHDLHGAVDAEARRALIAKIAPTTRAAWWFRRLATGAGPARQIPIRNHQCLGVG